MWSSKHMPEDIEKRRLRQLAYLARLREKDPDAFRRKESTRQAQRRERRKTEAAEACEEPGCVLL